VVTTNIIVGAGQAGAHAAIAMRDAGFTGRIVLVGDEPHHPHERPPLSKAMLTDAVEPPPSHFHDGARYGERDVELRLGIAVESIDRTSQRVLLHDGSALPYDKLLLATGGRARRLHIPGGEAILYLRTLDDARQLRPLLAPGARLVCIGAGVIGLEIASSARQRGCEVTVIEAAGTAMGRTLTPDFARYLEARHRDAGVALHFGAKVQCIEGRQVICDSATIEADLVVAGVGMERNTELAEAAGLALDGGIAVDEFGRTEDANIYAAGDVAAFWHPVLLRRMRLESWRHAQNHGIAVGRAMAGQAAPYDEIPWFWTDQHGVNLQFAGLAELAAATVMRGTMKDAAFAGFHLDAEDRVVAATGVNAPRDIRAAQSMIRAAKPVDPAMLADVEVPLQRIVASLK
jgi:3-phenylpropionate/trans-cinnamate dioxygenase ferredoxin reductase component